MTADDEGQRTQGEAVVAEAQQGDEIAVADRERGRRRSEDSTGTYEVVERVNAHTLKVRRVDGSGYARMKAHAIDEGVRVLTNGNGDPGVVWHEVALNVPEYVPTGHTRPVACHDCGPGVTLDTVETRRLAGWMGTNHDEGWERVLRCPECDQQGRLKAYDDGRTTRERMAAPRRHPDALGVQD
jgi:hypothetical protein